MGTGYSVGPACASAIVRVAQNWRVGAGIQCQYQYTPRTLFGARQGTTRRTTRETTTTIATSAGATTAAGATTTATTNLGRVGSILVDKGHVEDKLGDKEGRYIVDTYNKLHKVKFNRAL